LGIKNTLSAVMPLLSLPQVNPHATLITLFMEAVSEMSEIEIKETPGEIRRVAEYLKLCSTPTSIRDPMMSLLITALPSVRDGDSCFAR
jgi:hypothetical protein